MTIVLLYVLVQSVLVHSVASIIKCKIQQLAQDIVSHLHATHVHGNAWEMLRKGCLACFGCGSDDLVQSGDRLLGPTRG